MVNGIARLNWNTFLWEALGNLGDPTCANGDCGVFLTSGGPGDVRALAVHDGALYVGGRFLSVNAGVGEASAIKAEGVARWTGTAWEALHSPASAFQRPGVDGTVHAFLSYNGLLYLGGNFGRATTSDPSDDTLNFVNSVVQYDTGATGDGAFAALSKGLAFGEANSLVVFNDEIYAGGTFFSNPSTSECVPGIAKWSGAEWEDVGGGFLNAGAPLTSCTPLGWPAGNVRSLVVFQDELYAGGDFDYVGDGNTEVQGLARLVNGAWKEVGGGVSTAWSWGGHVSSLAVWSDGTATGNALYVAGLFTQVLPGQFDNDTPGVAASSIVRWDGGCWTPLTCNAGTDEGVGVNVTAPTLATYSSPDGEHSLVISKSTASAIGCTPTGRLARLLRAPDTDLDGISDLCDNCAVDQNASQQDDDNDGFGDVCDLCSCGADDLDLDGDGVADACDNCPAESNGLVCTQGANLGAACAIDADCDPNGVCEQADADADGYGDPCEAALPLPPTEFRLARVRDASGDQTVTFDYSDPLSVKRCAGSSCSAGDYMFKTTLNYDPTDGRLTDVVTAPDGCTDQTCERSYAVVYDPDFPERIVGSVDGSCGCAASTGSRFTFRDERNRIIKITTADVDGSGAPAGVTLEQFSYREDKGVIDACRDDSGDTNDDGFIDDRLTEHWRRNDAGQLALVHQRVYVGGPDGPFSTLSCNTVGIQFEVTKEDFASDGRLIARHAYEDRQSLCADPGPTLVQTSFQYDREFDGAGNIVKEVWTAEDPSPIGPNNTHLSVNEWEIASGSYFADPSTLVSRSYRLNQPEPGGTRITERVESSSFNPDLGSYRLASMTEPSRSSTEPGATTTYTYYDDIADYHPDRTRIIRRTGLDGSGETLVSVAHVLYDADGRVDIEIRTGPNGPTGNACADPAGNPLDPTCCPSAGGGCVATKFEYDQFDRLTRQTENFWDTNPLPRVTEFRYNAFGEQILSATLLDATAGKYLVRANAYNSEGQIEHEYSGEFTGTPTDLDTFESANPPFQLLEQTTFEYHAVSGRVTKTRTRLDAAPFTFDPLPTNTSDVVNTYDNGVTVGNTGTWLTAMTIPHSPGVPDPAVTAFRYDEQGRVAVTMAPRDSAMGINVYRRTVYDGRGLVEESLVEDSDAAMGSPAISLKTTTTYFPDGQVKYVKDPAGRYTVHSYDDFGRLFERKTCGSSDCTGEYQYVTIYNYDCSDNVTRQYTQDLSSAAPPEANTDISDTVTDYDALGRPYKVRRRATLGGDSPNDEVTITRFNSDGSVNRVAKDLDANPDAVTELVDQVTHFTYDNLGQLLETRRVNADSLGAQVDEITKQAYDESGRQVSQSVCLTAACVDPLTDSITKSEHDALGRVTKMIGPAGHYAVQDYDSRGNMIATTRFEEPNSAAGERDGLGGTAVAQDLFIYDEEGRLQQSATMRTPITPGGAGYPPTPVNTVDRVTDFEYFDDGNRKQIRTYNSNTAIALDTKFTYDGVGRLKTITDALNNSETNFYDEAGPPHRGLLDRRTTQDGRGTHQVAFTYDALGRVKSEIASASGGTDPAIETYFDAHDAADRPVVVRRKKDDPAGFVETHTAYDMLGRRTSVNEDAAAGGLARTTQFGYDALGRLTTLTATNVAGTPPLPIDQVTAYKYDLLGRQIEIQYPDSSGAADVVKFTYDKAGRRISKVAQDQTEISSTYDPRGLVVKRSSVPLVPGKWDDFVYDGLGRLLSATRNFIPFDQVDQEPVFVWRTYDAFSNLVSETQAIGPGHTIYYQYDQAGNRLCADCPLPPTQPEVARLDYTYDALNRVTSIDRNSKRVANYIYENSLNGRLLDKRELFLPDSLTRVATYNVDYDDHRRMNLIDNLVGVQPTQTSVAKFVSTFDSLGNRKTTTGTGVTPYDRSATYTYDELSRLDDATYTGTGAGVEDYTIDLLGNRTAYDPVTGSAIAYGAVNPANEYDDIGSVDVTYDARGNLIVNEHRYQFVYGPDDKLIEVKDPAGTSLVTYQYDALGRRARERRGSKLTYYFRDGDRIFAEYDAGNGDAWPPYPDPATLARYFIDGPLYVDEHVLIHEGGQDFYYLLGPLFSVVGLVDESGALAYKYAYDAYGRPIQVPLPPPTVEGVGSRALKVTLPACGDPIAIRVEKQTPIACDPLEDIHVRYATTPLALPMPYVPFDSHSTAWVNNSEPDYFSPLEWSSDGVVYLTGRIFEPESNYTVSFETADRIISELVNVSTTMWGDADLNGVVNVFDVTNAVDMLKGAIDPTNPPAWDFEASNVWDCAVDVHVNIIDVTSAVDALKSIPFDCSGSCDEGFSGGASSTAGDPHCKNPYFFTGRRLDFNRWTNDFTGPALVLYDYRARPYDAWNGRFLSRDPLGYVDGMNLYEYVTSRPTTDVDPTGQFGWSIHQEITRLGFRASGLSFRSSATLGQVASHNSRTDLLHLLNDDYHAARPTFTNKVRELMADIREARCPAGVHNRRIDISKTSGRILHILQDLYSHTDWVEGTRMNPLYDYWRQEAEKYRQSMPGLHGEQTFGLSSEASAFLRLAAFRRASVNAPRGPSDTIKLDALAAGAGANIGGLVYFTGGLNKEAKFDPHNRFGADMSGFGRAGPAPGGLGPDAFFRAREAARLTTRDYFVWLEENLRPECRCRVFQGPRRE